MNDVDRPEDLVKSSRTQVPGHLVITFAESVTDIRYTVQCTQKDVPYLSHRGVEGTMLGRLHDEAPHTLIFPVEAHMLYLITILVNDKRLTWIA